MAKKSTKRPATNFWSGETANPETQTKSTKHTGVNPVRKKSKLDLRWIFAAIVLVVAIVATVVINTDYTRTDSAKIANNLDIDNGDLKINWERYQTIGVKLSDSFTITESGTYHLTGILDNGAITIDAGVSEVRLILDNATIKNQSGPAINCQNAEDLVIELIGESTIEDGSTYSDITDEDITGAIYSKADLTFQGNGTLNLTGNYQDAIVGKDDVKFNSGTYNITAKDDGIRGKDSVYIVGGDLNINATATAIKTTNDLDAGKGFILVEGGNLNLATSENKGLRSTRFILIYGGNIVADTYDDAIHCDGYIGIIGGNLTINSGDDGIHANTELIIDGGNVNIEKAYEGIESQVITINNGDINLTTADDGINAGGGADNSATTTTSNRKSVAKFDADESCILTINGGNIYVNATGDGIDSNGYLYFNGGTTIVDGPTNNGNGSLDSSMGIVMNGGEVLAVGSAGMAESLGSNSTIYNISVFFTSIQPANTTVAIKDSSKNTIIEHVAAKQFSHLAAGTTKFIPGETYTIYLNDTEYTQLTINDITTNIGGGKNNYNNFKK